MISVRQCLEFSGLTFNDLVIGTSTSEKHRGLLESYLLNIDRGASTVRKMIVADLRAFLDLGLLASAADAFIVLRLFLSDYPEARLTSDGMQSNDQIPVGELDGPGSFVQGRHARQAAAQRAEVDFLSLCAEREFTPGGAFASAAVR